ncbi:MAG: ATP-binding protein [Anaerolineae bacterium]|nr:ATP-binding protein [Anaerolineae bacterium]
MNSLTNIDEIILREFPYPIALAYQHLLTTEDARARSLECVQTFHFTIRAIAFAAIMRYLAEPPEVINNEQLNKGIQDYLKTPRTKYWADLLQKTLQAYQNRKDLLFVPELYDLYWDTNEAEATPKQETWQLLLEMARFSNDVQDKRIDLEAAADELQRMLRRVLEQFVFLRHYELWYLHEIQGNRLTVEVYKGQEKSIRHPRLEDISLDTMSRLELGHFYVRDRQNRLLELHPLIISGDYLRRLGDRYRDDTGVYEEFRDKDTEDVEDDEIVYFMLATNEAKAVSGDLVAMFRHLYDHELARKQQALTAVRPINELNLRLACEEYTERQTMTAAGKYIEQAYIERDEFNQLLDSFLNTKEPIMVISGNAGVGKTNLIYHYYRTVLKHDSQSITLWLDGAILKPDLSLAETILSAWDPVFNFNPASEDETQALRFLREILTTHLADKRLVLLIDGLNENNHPLQVFNRVNDLALEFPVGGPIRMVVTTRPQVWTHAKSKVLQLRFKSYNYMTHLPEGLDNTLIKAENDSFVMTPYQGSELVRAFDKYAAYYRITEPDLEHLDKSLQRAMQEPLLMRFTCQAFEGKPIPKEMRSDEIIERLIEGLISNQEVNLYHEDFEFLQKWIVPQFLPEGKLPRAGLSKSTLQSVWVEDVDVNRSLDALVIDSTEYTDGTTVNARVQRLMRTGWLAFIGVPSRYELRFHYEYFYDYFVGKYLFDQYKTAADRQAFFRLHMRYLNEAPFLWGSMSNLLVDLLKQGEYTLIESLGYTNDTMQYELLSSILSQQYATHKAQIHAVLLKWFASNEHSSLAPRLAANLAVNCKIEDILNLALRDPRDTVRYLVVQDIQLIWKQDHQIAANLITNLADRIRLWHVRTFQQDIETFIRCSFLLLLFDYWFEGDKTQVIPLLQNLWRQVINRLMLVSNVRPIELGLRALRRLILRLLVKRIRVIIRSAGGATGEIFFDFEDFEYAFTSAKGREEIFDYLLKHIDAAAGFAPTKVDLFADYIHKLAAEGYNDFLTIGLALIGMASHFFNDPIATTHALNKLQHRFDDLYQPTTDPKIPTASLWAVMMTVPFGNIINFRGQIDRDALQSVVLEIMDTEFLHEERYWGVSKLSTGSSLRNAVLPASMVSAFAFGFLDLGIEQVKRLTELFLKRQEDSRLAQLPSRLADMILPKESAEGIYTAIQTMKPYLNQLENPRRDALWNLLTDGILLYTTNLGEHYDQLVAQIQRDDEIPLKVRQRLGSAKRQENFDVIFGVAAILFVVAALKNRNMFISQKILAWGFLKAIEIPDFEKWLYACTVYVGNLVYGDEIL